MAEKNEAKILVIIDKFMYYYKVMPFGLKMQGKMLEAC